MESRTYSRRLQQRLGGSRCRPDVRRLDRQPDRGFGRTPCRIQRIGFADADPGARQHEECVSPVVAAGSCRNLRTIRRRCETSTGCHCRSADDRRACPDAAKGCPAVSFTNATPETQIFKIASCSSSQASLVSGQGCQPLPAFALTHPSSGPFCGRMSPLSMNFYSLHNQQLMARYFDN